MAKTVEKKQMNVAVSISQDSFYPAYVMLKSLFDNNSDSSIILYIMYNNLPEEWLADYGKLAKEYGGKVCFLYMDEEPFSGILQAIQKDRAGEHDCPVIEDVMPKEAKRILYLDTDLIINGNIRNFYDTDFNSRLFCVCKENTADFRGYYQLAEEAHNEGKDYSYVKENVRIVHFTKGKPWGTDHIHYDIEQIWWDYAKKTPYYKKLCQDFTYCMMHDSTVESFVTELCHQMNTLQENLKESLDINRQLVEMIGSK